MSIRWSQDGVERWRRGAGRYKKPTRRFCIPPRLSVLICRHEEMSTWENGSGVHHVAWWLLCARCVTGFGSLGTLRVTSGWVSAQSLFGLLRATTAAHSSGSRCPSLACLLSIAALPCSVLFRLHGTSLCSVPPYPLSLFLSAELRLAIHKTKQNKKYFDFHTWMYLKTKQRNQKNPQIKPIPPQRFWNVFWKHTIGKFLHFALPTPLFFYYFFLTSTVLTVVLV